MPTLTEQSTITKRQWAKFGPKHYDDNGEACTITAEVRYDDDCGNGHNSFSITGSIKAVKSAYRGDDRERSSGCIHEQIAAAFPELAPLIRWHLCSSDGPMHGIANTIYHASNKDCWGRSAGEASSFAHGVRFSESPITHRIDGKFYEFLKDRYRDDEATGATFQVVAIAHGPSDYKFADHYTFVGFGDKWHECPFRDRTEADEFAQAINFCKTTFVKVPTAWSEGKARDLDAARSCAVWPDATDEDLTAPGLKERLEARLPALLAEFRLAVESLGFVW